MTHRNNRLCWIYYAVSLSMNMKLLVVLGLLLFVSLSLTGCAMLGISKEVTPAPCEDARYKQLLAKPSLTAAEQNEWDSLRTLCDTLIAQRDRKDRDEERTNLMTSLYVSAALAAAMITAAILFRGRSTD